MNNKKRIVVGITGASGAPIAITLLKALRNISSIESHVIISKSAKLTIKQETSYTIKEVKALANRVYPINDIAAKISSGTFKTEGMIIVPCSMKTLAAINHGYGNNLIHRAADVTIKEKRKLLLVPRETPLSQIHLRNMFELSQLGVDIMPPVLGYYNNPQTIQDITNHIVGKILDVFDIDYSHFKRWNGLNKKLKVA